MDDRELVEKFLRYLSIEKESSENTIKNYKIDIVTFDDYIHDKYNINITEVEEHHVEEYKRYMKEKQHWVNSTRARRVTSLREFYKYIKRKNYIKENPMEYITTPEVKRREAKVLSVEEAKKLLSAGDNERDKLILTMFLNTGLRVEELTNVSLTDIENNQLRVIGKGNKERIIDLNAETMEALNNYLKVRPNVPNIPYLFISNRKQHMAKRTVQYTINKYLHIARLDKDGRSTHTLRHTFATSMLEAEVKLKTIQEMLGHSNIATTERYLHITNKEKKEAVNKLDLLYNN